MDESEVARFQSRLPRLPRPPAHSRFAPPAPEMSRGERERERAQQPLCAHSSDAPTVARRVASRRVGRKVFSRTRNAHAGTLRRRHGDWNAHLGIPARNSNAQQCTATRCCCPAEPSVERGVDVLVSPRVCSERSDAHLNRFGLSPWQIRCKSHAVHPHCIRNAEHGTAISRRCN